jgi:hypothetical protein
MSDFDFDFDLTPASIEDILNNKLHEMRREVEKEYLEMKGLENSIAEILQYHQIKIDRVKELINSMNKLGYTPRPWNPLSLNWEGKGISLDYFD